MPSDLSYIKRIKDPIILGNLIDNANKELGGERRDEALRTRKEAYDQLWDVLASKNAPSNTLEWDLWVALSAYESLLSLKNDRKSYATRLRQKIKRSSIIEAATGAVKKGGGSFGFRYLVEMNRLDASFESVVLKHSEAFPKDVVEQAKKTLDEVIRNKK